MIFSFPEHAAIGVRRSMLTRGALFALSYDPEAAVCIATDADAEHGWLADVNLLNGAAGHEPLDRIVYRVEQTGPMTLRFVR